VSTRVIRLYDSMEVAMGHDRRSNSGKGRFVQDRFMTGSLRQKGGQQGQKKTAVAFRRRGRFSDSRRVLGDVVLLGPTGLLRIPAARAIRNDAKYAQPGTGGRSACEGGNTSAWRSRSDCGLNSVALSLVSCQRSAVAVVPRPAVELTGQGRAGAQSAGRYFERPSQRSLQARRPASVSSRTFALQVSSSARAFSQRRKPCSCLWLALIEHLR
jgi:hypothetical protein